MTTTFKVNTTGKRRRRRNRRRGQERELRAVLGFIGDTTAVPRCSAAEFLDMALGATAPQNAQTTLRSAPSPSTSAGGLSSPVYNLDSASRRRAQLGFYVLNVPVTIDVGVKNAPAYNVVGLAAQFSQALRFYRVEADPVGCPGRSVARFGTGPLLPVFSATASCPSSAPLRPFLTLPRSCQGPLRAATKRGLGGTRRAARQGTVCSTHDAAEPPNPQGMTGCGKLGFGPTITAKPTTKAAAIANRPGLQPRRQRRRPANPERPRQRRHQEGRRHPARGLLAPTPRWPKA